MVVVRLFLLSSLVLVAAVASKKVKYTCPTDSRQSASMIFTEVQILIDGDCNAEQEQPLGKFLKSSFDRALSKKGIVHNAHSTFCERPVNSKNCVDSELDAILGLAQTQEMMMMANGASDADFFQQQHNANSHYVYKGGFKGLYCPKEKKGASNRRLRSRKSKDHHEADSKEPKKDAGTPTKIDKKVKPKKPKCVTVDRVSMVESFKEGTDVSSWTNGRIGMHRGLSILGPYARHESTNTSLVLSSSVDMVVLKFDFVETGAWGDNDYLGIIIGEKDKFGLKEALKQEGKVRSGHTKGGVSWAVKAKTHSFANGFSHRVVIHVPKTHFTAIEGLSGRKKLGFQINVKGNGGGLDNFQMSTRTMCSKKLPKQSSTSAELPNEQMVEDKISDYITKDLQQHFGGCEFAEAHVHVYSRERWEDAMPQCAAEDSGNNNNQLNPSNREGVE